MVRVRLMPINPGPAKAVSLLTRLGARLSDLLGQHLICHIQQFQSVNHTR